MAKQKSKPARAAKPKTSRPRRSRAVYNRVKTASKGHGLRWGEIVLSAIVGYEGDKVISGVGLEDPLANLYNKNEYTALMLNDVYQSGGEPAASRMTNKLLGLAALMKSGYDVVKHKHLNDQDKNILVPFAIGTVFDAKNNNSNTQSGGWK